MLGESPAQVGASLWLGRVRNSTPVRNRASPGDASIEPQAGAYEIAKPVTVAVLATVAAFSPLLFVPGMPGTVFWVIPLVVIPCLLFSLLESLNIPPADLSHIPNASAAGRGDGSSLTLRTG